MPNPVSAMSTKITVHWLPGSPSPKLTRMPTVNIPSSSFRRWTRGRRKEIGNEKRMKAPLTTIVPKAASDVESPSMWRAVGIHCRSRNQAIQLAR